MMLGKIKFILVFILFFCVFDVNVRSEPIPENTNLSPEMFTSLEGDDRAQALAVCRLIESRSDGKTRIKDIYTEDILFLQSSSAPWFNVSSIAVHTDQIRIYLPGSDLLICYYDPYSPANQLLPPFSDWESVSTHVVNEHVNRRIVRIAPALTHEKNGIMPLEGMAPILEHDGIEVIDANELLESGGITKEGFKDKVVEHWNSLVSLIDGEDAESDSLQGVQEDVSSSLEDLGKNKFFFLRKGNDILGVAQIVITESSHELLLLSIDPKKRAGGLGSFFYDAIFIWLQENDIKTLKIKATTGMKRSLKFHTKYLDRIEAEYDIDTNDRGVVPIIVKNIDKIDIRENIRRDNEFMNVAKGEGVNVGPSSETAYEESLSSVDRDERTGNLSSLLERGDIKVYNAREYMSSDNITPERLAERISFIMEQAFPSDDPSVQGSYEEWLNILSPVDMEERILLNPFPPELFITVAGSEVTGFMSFEVSDGSHSSNLNYIAVDRPYNGYGSALMDAYYKYLSSRGIENVHYLSTSGFHEKYLKSREASYTKDDIYNIVDKKRFIESFPGMEKVWEQLQKKGWLEKINDEEARLLPFENRRPPGVLQRKFKSNLEEIKRFLAKFYQAHFEVDVDSVDPPQPDVIFEKGDIKVIEAKSYIKAGYSSMKDLAAFIAEMVRQEFHSDTDHEEWHSTWDAKWSANLEKSRDRVLLLLKNDKLIGFSHLEVFPDAKRSRENLILISPGERGKGYGVLFSDVEYLFLKKEGIQTNVFYSTKEALSFHRNYLESKEADFSIEPVYDANILVNVAVDNMKLPQDILILKEYINDSLMPVLRSLTTDMLYRIPVEILEQMGPENAAGIISALDDAGNTIDGRPERYVELFYMTSYDEVSENVYSRFGITRKHFPFGRTRGNTITVFPSFKTDNISQEVIKTRIGDMSLSPTDTILVPSGLQLDPAGLVRSLVLGSRLAFIARQKTALGRTDPDFAEATITEYSKICGESSVEISPDEIIDFVSTDDINKVVSVLQRLVRMLPAEPVDIEYLKEIYEHTRQVLLAA